MFQRSTNKHRLLKESLKDYSTFCDKTLSSSLQTDPPREKNLKELKISVVEEKPPVIDQMILSWNCQGVESFLIVRRLREFQ